MSVRRFSRRDITRDIKTVAELIHETEVLGQDEVQRDKETHYNLWLLLVLCISVNALKTPGNQYCNGFNTRRVQAVYSFLLIVFAHPYYPRNSCRNAIYVMHERTRKGRNLNTQKVGSRLR